LLPPLFPPFLESFSSLSSPPLTGTSEPLSFRHSYSPLPQKRSRTFLRSVPPPSLRTSPIERRLPPSLLTETRPPHGSPPLGMEHPFLLLFLSNRRERFSYYSPFFPSKKFFFLFFFFPKMRIALFIDTSFSFFFPSPCRRDDLPPLPPLW